MSLQRVVVTGGSGYVGRSVCARLAAHNPQLRIVVPTRRRANARALGPLPNVEVVEASVHDAQAMAALLRGADALVHLVAILHGNERAFEQVHVELPRRLVQACWDAGVRRVLHVSALGVAEDAPSMYLRSKARGEAVWRTSGLDLTILRPSVIFGADDAFTNLFAGLQQLFPLVPLGGANAQFQPVWVEDVAEAAVRCLERPETIGQTIECAGPRVMTLAEVVRASGARVGRVRPIVPLPAPLTLLQAALLECLPVPVMSRDNVRSMQVPNIASGRLPGLGSLGITPAPIELLARRAPS